MYKEIKRITDASVHVFYNGNYVCHNKYIKTKKLTRKPYLSISNAEDIVVWKSPEEMVVALFVVNNVLIYNVNEDHAIARHTSNLGQELYRLDHRMGGLVKYPDNNTVQIYNPPKGRYNMNILTGEVLKTYPEHEMYIHTITDCLYICMKDFGSKLIITDYDFNIIWQRDISVECQYNDMPSGTLTKGRITSVIVYQNKYVIISTMMSHCICMEIETGKVVWRKPGNSIWWYATKDNIAYCITNRALYYMDMETGVDADYGWTHSALPDFVVDGKKFTPLVDDIQYVDGLLWLIAFDRASGRSCILAVNPHNGHYEWIHHVDTKDKVMSMKFYEGRMYLNSTRDLLIYAKDKT